MRRHFSCLSPSVGLTFLGLLAVACGDSPIAPGPVPTPGKGSSALNMPCDVAAVVEEHCSLCHGKEPAYSAPMALVTQADFQKVSAAGEPYYKLALERIHETSKLRMPPTSQDDVPEAELAILDAWLSGGAPKNTEECGSGDGDNGDGDKGSSGDGDGDEFGNGDGDTGDGDSNEGDGGTAPDGPVKFEYPELKPEDCEKSIELRAFNPNNPSEGFPVGQNTNNTYECFDFEVPYDSKMQALQIEPIIDDKRVVHHWLVYDAKGATTGKQYWNCAGQHPAAQLIAGWAAGRGATKMPKGVGLRLPQKGSAKFTLEVHYNNSVRAAGVKDRSGARICATSKLQKEEAAVHWLGTEAIFGPIAQGTCSVQKTATIISSWPHMHAMGNHMKMELKKKGSSSSIVMLDKAFSFDNQVAYDTPMRVGQGDVITTTCNYDGIATFGTDSEKEMCYNYVLAYPAGALSFGGSLTITDATCLQ